MNVDNTTVLSNFASIGQLPVLHQLFTVVHLPTQVYEDIERGLAEGYQSYECWGTSAL
jgi:predicted nucleic acid-binding protein